MMLPAGQPILTAAAMRAAEQRAISAGATVEGLMARAGREVATAVRRLAGAAPALVLCGPGNNGGDGYVAARLLREAGSEVRVAASADPATPAAQAARRGWGGEVATLADAEPAPILVDALFGTGLTRPIDPALRDRLNGLVARSRLSIAVDLPSGLGSDGGTAARDGGDVTVDVTLALGALKPAHVLYPAADRCGTVRVLDIGLGLIDRPMDEVGRDWTMDRPVVAAPDSVSHKYSRGLVVVIGGEMPGAGALAAAAAMHAGAGYVVLFGEPASSAPPHALVRKPWSRQALARTIEGKDGSRTAIVVGPGLGRGDDAADKLDAAIASGLPLVVDGDALRLLDQDALARFRQRPPRIPVVLTPHDGEFRAVFGDWSGSKLDAARQAAVQSGAIVVHKGPDTVVAYPDGRTRTGLAASSWLSTAGSGDVLAGTVAAMLAATTAAPAESAVWMHAEAARRLGAAFVADDLARALAGVRAGL